MAEFVVMLDAPNSMKTKTVQVYLEDDAGDHRQIRREDVPIAVDVDAYVANNFSQLFGIADPLADDVWNAAFEATFRDLHRQVVLAGYNAAKGNLATLSTVTTAMEAVILASDKAGEYTRLKTLAAAATSVQRDALFVLLGYLTISDLLADDL